MNSSLSERPASGSPRWVGSPIRLSALIYFLKRAALAHRAGIDLLTFWKKESENGPADLRRASGLIHERLRAGDTLSAAMAAARGFFPPLVLEMTVVGESTGRLDEIFNGLHDHYSHLRDLRRSLISGLIWPAIQMGIAIAVVGLLIWIPSFISGASGGPPIDILGFGLVGTSGLMIYFAGIVTLAAALGFFVFAMRQGWLGAAPLRACLRIPALGGTLRTAALARFSWTLALTLESGLDARRSLRMALRSMQFPHISEAADRGDAVILRGGEFHEACQAVGGFPDEFLASLAAAEQGQVISESLHHLSQQYTEQAQLANKMFTTFASFAIWGGVAVMIIFLIFRLFMFYMGQLNEALNMAQPGAF